MLKGTVNLRPSTILKWLSTKVTYEGCSLAFRGCVLDVLFSHGGWAVRSSQPTDRVWVSSLVIAHCTMRLLQVRLEGAVEWLQEHREERTVWARGWGSVPWSAVFWMGCTGEMPTCADKAEGQTTSWEDGICRTRRGRRWGWGLILPQHVIYMCEIVTNKGE